MLPGKTLLVLTGPSTVGKTTLAEALTGPGGNPNCMAVPCTVSRASRLGETSPTLRFVTEREFGMIDFTCSISGYGLSTNELMRFALDLNAEVGVYVGSPMELIQLKETAVREASDLKVIGVVLRYTDSLSRELEVLRRQIPIQRAGDSLSNRLSRMERLATDYFHNSDFLHKYVDVVLERGALCPVALTESLGRAIGFPTVRDRIQMERSVSRALAATDLDVKNQSRCRGEYPR